MKNRSGALLLVGPGAHGDLCSDTWVSGMTQEAISAGRQAPQIRRLSEPVFVGGVGTGAQQCTEEVIAHIGVGGDSMTYGAPIVSGSQIPAPLGIKSLKER